MVIFLPKEQKYFDREFHELFKLRELYPPVGYSYFPGKLNL